MTYDLAVVGLGYVGLPLVAEATKSGLSVVGFDIHEGVVASLNAGESHIDDLSEAEVTHLVELGFRATTDEAVLREAKTIVICVPTPLGEDGSPDLRAIKGATATIARNLTADTLVVLESTTYPGTTEELLLPEFEATGLTLGEGFNLAFSPERVDPGNPVYGIKNTPKVVGGVTPACTERASEFYELFIDSVVRARGVREAETAKLLENTYRHINIALVNEMARFCHDLGIDLWDVINLAKTKPFGFQAFYPGPGVGGHCIPIDPNYLSYNVRTRLGYPFRFVELAQEINSSMPLYVADRAQRLLNDQGIAVRGATVLLLGVTYKPDIADQRESPAVELGEALLELGADLQYHDPHVAEWNLPHRDLTPVADLEAAVAAADLVILVQNHKDYDASALAALSKLFFDTRGATTEEGIHRL